MSYLLATARAQGHEPEVHMHQYGVDFVVCRRCWCSQILESMGWMYLPCTGVSCEAWSEEMRAQQDQLFTEEQERRNGEYVRRHAEAFDAATRWRYGAEEQA